MSIPVEVGDLAAALDGFGAGYLLTTSAAGQVKVVAVEPSIAHGVLSVRSPGRGTLANLSGNPTVTLLFPPLEQRGYTLLVDGAAEVEADDVRVTPSGAVLHRPSSHADGPAAPDGCGHDCQPLP